MTIMPGETPCLRCVFEAAPGPGEPAPARRPACWRRSSTSSPAIRRPRRLKILAGNQRRDQPRADLHRHLGEHATGASRSRRCWRKVDCPCCATAHVRVARRRPRLADDEPVRPQCRAGRRTALPAKLDFEEMAGAPRALGGGELQQLPAQVPTTRRASFEFTVFPDGRAIIKGTSDVDKARTLYAKYIGH